VPVPGDDENTRERLAVIGEIAAEAAHELRNVLQVVASSAYLARVDPAASLPHVLKIERNARLAQAIVDDLMALARGEPMRAEQVALSELVLAARIDMPGGAAEWDDRLTPTDLRVRAHPGLFARVLHALYDNAVEAAAGLREGRGRGPRIVTLAARAGDRVLIDVRDDGPGVPAGLAPTIFDPMVSGRHGGSGLGLALAKRVVAAHGGTITLLDPASADASPGATFRIDLPA
jgi:signal transduction histidine kinase